MKKKLALIFAAITLLSALSGCSKKCENGCEKSANPDCMADMCDKCCNYFMGLNGCYANH